MTFRYLDGCERAEAEGLITRGPIVHDDRHSPLPPLGSLGHFNTRGLDDIGVLLATMAGKQPGSRALVLGAGTGVACNDMKKVAPTLRVEAVSLSHFNSYVRILLRGHDIYTQVGALIGEEALKQRREGTTYDVDHRMQLASYVAMPEDELLADIKALGRDPRTDPDSHVPTELLEELQNAGRLQAFETLDTSVCDRQHITRFPDEFASPEPFDLIVDDRGPLYYVKLEDCGTQNDGTRNAIELLSPKGLLYVAHHDPMCGRASGIRDALGNTFADALFIQGAPELLVVREQHQLYLALRRCVDRRQPEDERGIRQLGWKHNMRDVVLEACNE